MYKLRAHFVPRIYRKVDHNCNKDCQKYKKKNITLFFVVFKGFFDFCSSKFRSFYFILNRCGILSQNLVNLAKGEGGLGVLMGSAHTTIIQKSSRNVFKSSTIGRIVASIAVPCIEQKYHYEYTNDWLRIETTERLLKCRSPIRHTWTE